MKRRHQLFVLLWAAMASAGCRAPEPSTASGNVFRTASLTTPSVSASLDEVEVTDVTVEPAMRPATDTEPNLPLLPPAITLTAETSDVVEPMLPMQVPATLVALESIALGRHPTIVRAQQQVAAARGQFQQAGLPPNPLLQYQSEEIGNEGGTGLHSITVSQQYITANKLGLAQQVQTHQVARLSAALRLAELRVLTELRVAFAQTLIAQRRAELANQIVTLSEQSVRSAEQLLQAQEISKIALLQAQVEAEQARISADNAATLLEANRRTLAAAAAMERLPSADLRGELEDGLQPRPWEATLETLATTSPELMAVGSQLDRARWALQLACAQVTPNVTAQVGIGVDSVSDDTFAVLGVSVPLPVRNRNQGNIRTARANVAAASAAIEQTALDLEGRLAQAAGRYEAARVRYERLRDNVLPGAEETFELSKTAFEAGESNYLTLLTAQRTLVNTRLRILDALGEARQAAAQIDGLLVTLP